MVKNNLNIQEIQEVFAYDPETGVFTWKRGNRKGKEAGTLNRGYRQLKYRGFKAYAHQVAFVIMENRWPAECVDHIDRNKLNNRWSNLREASITENNHNGRISRASSGYLNVTWHKELQKWMVRLHDKQGLIRGTTKYFPYSGLEDAVNYANLLRRTFHGDFAIQEMFKGSIPDVAQLNS
ncbi:homing endonuclease [Shigella phage SHSML-45]|uniref:Homing endonuclease n=1 Tax=Shigella phage SHSML-45 TaxID=1863010 RepID=A0A193H133_9CAUD|nr:homing endonuclease [Shigella phage SHSML-45]ANN87092.1 homing endonuclease [Shigella phage SHSML-45]